MKKIHFFGIILIISLYSILITNKQSNAQYIDYTFNHISTTDGLSNFTVLSITEDKQGFMWFGTMDGLNRFDGEQIKVYRENPEDSLSLGSSYIWSLLCTSDSNMWVGTNRGLYRYDFFHDHFHFVSTKNSNGDPIIMSIRSLFQQNDILWIGTESGFFKYDLKNEDFIPFDGQTEYLKKIGIVHCLLASESDELWVGSDQGLFKLSGNNLISIQLSEYADRNLIVRSITKDSKGNIWLGTDNRDVGLIIYNPETQKTHELSFKNGKLPNNRIRSLFRSQVGEIWVGTRDGLAILDEITLDSRILLHDRFERFNLSQNSIRPIYESREGIIWIGTYSGGVNYFDPRTKLITHFTDAINYENTINYNIITSIYKDEDDELWLGTEGRGVNIYNTEKAKFRYIRRKSNGTGLIHESIKEILEDKKGRKFIATDNGLSIYNPVDDSFFNITEKPSERGYINYNTVHDLCEDQYGNIWLGTTGNLGRFQMYDVDRDTIFHFLMDKEESDKLINIEINVQFYDEANNILWAGGNNGLGAFNVESKSYLLEGKYLEIVKAFRGLIITDLYMNNQGLLWVGTFSRGLYIINTNTYEIRKVTKEDGFYDYSIYSLIDDNSGNIWAAANSHLLKISNIENIHDKIGSIENYGIQEGFPPQQYYRKSAFNDTEGNLYFGGHNGFIKFNPADLKNIIIHPSVVLTNIMVNGNPLIEETNQDGQKQNINVSALKNIDLKYDQSNFSVHFIAPNYLNPKNTWYQYQLSGLIDTWQDLGNSNSINFTKLKYGEYDLKIRASSDPFIFSGQFTNLKLEIEPHFLRTPLAYLIYIMIILVLLYLLFAFTRKWEHLNHNLKLEHFERTKEHEFHQRRIKFFTDISHELRTPLTLILAPLEQIATSKFGNARIKNQLMLMLRNGERMLQLISQLLDLRKLETGHSQVNVAKGNIAHFIKEVSLSFRELAQNRGINYKVECSQSNIIAWFDRDKFEIILFNLLSNALKYTPDRGEIDIYVDIIKNQQNEVIKTKSNHSENANSITIQIKNTGRGIPGDQIDHIFERFYSGKSIHENKKYSSGVGLEIVKKLVDLHKGQISIESKYDENGIDGSACFTLILKQGKKHFSEDEIMKDYRSSDDISSYMKPIELIESDDQIEIYSKQESSESEIKDDTVLIVEDNPEVRRLVIDLFKEQYNILEANNGDEGIKIAIKEIPDLIISDIMMPGTDGIELCRIIKTNINTSHIPVILLTARTAVTFKYEGLETGADDYIVKPFSVIDLRLRAANLIKQRRLLKERFSRHSFLSPEEISLTSFDEKMLQRAIDCIMEHIHDKDLTIEKISKDVGMSRVHFYRKIKALTNLSASGFLRKVRMEYAAKLIKTNKLNISEVRNRIGISDADYFRKCFKAQYGVTPKEYQESIQTSPE